MEKVSGSFVNAAGEDYLSDFFKKSALPAREEETADDEAEGVFLSEFMSYADVGASGAPARDEAEHKHGIDIKFSRFVSSYAKAVGDADVGLIRITYAVMPSDRMFVFRDDALLIAYTMSGEGDINLGGRTAALRKYDCVCAPCGEGMQFRARPGEPWEAAFVRISGGVIPSALSAVSGRLECGDSIFLTFGAGSRFRSVVWEMLNPMTDAHPESEFIFNHLLLCLFCEFSLRAISSGARRTVVPDVIASIQAHIDRSYFTDITLDNLSKKFGLSKFHMAREFKRCIGKSPIDYLIDLRISKAKEMLTDSSRSVADICRLVGISNANHFLYLFKKREGMTPTAFRKRGI